MDNKERIKYLRKKEERTHRLADLIENLAKIAGRPFPDNEVLSIEKSEIVATEIISSDFFQSTLIILYPTTQSQKFHQYRRKDLTVNFTSIDKNKIKLKVLDNETAIDSLTIKGKYRKGYFKVRRQVNANFIAGPLLWVLAENTKYIGLTKDNNLVIMNSGGSGLLLLIALPIFAAGGGQTDVEYERQQ